MRFSVSFLVAAAAIVGFTAAADQVNPKTIKADVVIIGGGGSGAYAAVRLKDQGHSVVVLERKNQLGGHMETYVDPTTGTPFDTGVIVFHNISVVRDYYGRFDVPLRDAPPFATGAITALNFRTGRPVDGYQPTPPQELGAALAAYAPIIARYPYLGPSLMDLPNPVPSELLIPFGEFVEREGLQGMVDFLGTIEAQNGEILSRPTLYVLHCFSNMLFAAVSQGFVNAASGDNRDLYKGVSDFLGDDVFLDAKIEKVERGGDGIRKGVVVVARTRAGRVRIEAKKLLVAIPPLVENLKDIGMAPTTAEARLFAKWKYFWYSTQILEHDGLNSSVVLDNVGPKPPHYMYEQPSAFGYSAPIAGGNSVLAHIGSEDPASMSKEKCFNIIRGELGRIEAAGYISPGRPNFKFFSNHAPYRMHTSLEDVQGGFYKKIFELQGKEDTYYTGAAWSDNDSSLIWTWSEEFLLPRIVKAIQD